MQRLNSQVEDFMLKKISMIAAAGAFLALASTAQAITPAPIGTPSDVIEVAGGCGQGWFRNAYGRCIPMAARYGRYVRPVVVCRTVRTVYGWRKVCR
jgi:hypothetical protein